MQKKNVASPQDKFLNPEESRRVSWVAKSSWAVPTFYFFSLKKRYVAKGLGDKVCDDPFTVRLRFEPAGRPEVGDVCREYNCISLVKTELYHARAAHTSNFHLSSSLLWPNTPQNCTLAFNWRRVPPPKKPGPTLSQELQSVQGLAGEYYLKVKSNQCVVCGREESYLRKYVVPHEYRKHFPEVMRDHSSHDVLLMCHHCHVQSNLMDLNLRQCCQIF